MLCIEDWLQRGCCKGIWGYLKVPPLGVAPWGVPLGTPPGGGPLVFYALHRRLGRPSMGDMLCIEDWWPLYGKATKTYSHIRLGLLGYKHPPSPLFIMSYPLNPRGGAAHKTSLKCQLFWHFKEVFCIYNLY
jgi:hypothetical protein